MFASQRLLFIAKSEFPVCWGLFSGKLAVKGQEADSNGDRARKLQRELESTRKDAEDILQVTLY